MEFSSPNPFAEALQFVDDKEALPTNLSSAELRQQLSSQAMRSSLFSARTTLSDYLEDIRTNLLKVLGPTTEQRLDRVTPENPEGNVTVGMDNATMRLKLKQALRQYGYMPSPEDRGTIKDLSSDGRLDLIIQTNKDIARGFGWHMQGQDQAVLDAFPCQELIRVEVRHKERNWPERWLAAANAVGDDDAIRTFEETGRMIARKDSPIWQALGDGEGGFDGDSLGNPFPPFAFNSGEGVRDVGYRESVALGAIKPGQKVTPQLLDYPSMEEN